jgi:hypothetical protein
MFSVMTVSFERSTIFAVSVSGNLKSLDVVMMPDCCANEIGSRTSPGTKTCGNLCTSCRSSGRAWLVGEFDELQARSDVSAEPKPSAETDP